MGMLAQVIGVLFGAIGGYGLGSMLIFGVDNEKVDLSFVLAGAGAVLGMLIGRLIANRYQREVESSRKKA